MIGLIVQIDSPAGQCTHRRWRRVRVSELRDWDVRGTIDGWRTPGSLRELRPAEQGVSVARGQGAAAVIRACRVTRRQYLM